MAYVGKAPATSVLTSADIQDGVISTNKIANDAVVSSKISDGTVTNSDLQYYSITINGSPVSLGGSVTIGETKPTITSISPNTIDNTQTEIVITGTNFEITPNVELISTTGAITLADTITRNSATQLTINATLTVDGTYFIRIENPNGLAVRSSTALLTVSDAPTWSTSAGSLGSVAAGSAGSFTVVATSDSAVTYSKSSGDFPTGLTLNGSTGVISGTEAGSDTNDTNYNFTIVATDGESQTASRAFTITVTLPNINNAGQFN